MINLDHNATTRIAAEALDVLSRHLLEDYANPGSRHALGRRARRVLESSRESMAGLLGAEPDEVIFTSGGTEANNLALFGLARGKPGLLALTPGEHPSVMEPALRLTGAGWTLHSLPIDSAGRLVEPRPLPEATRLAAVLLAHNETGVIQDVADLAAHCRERQIPLHLDAVQAVGKIPVDFHALDAASLSLGAHKFCGPRGVGALLLRRGWKLAPVLFGGHQELDRRPGTEPVALIAAMARALELAHAAGEARRQQVQALRDRLQAGLLDQCAPAIVNGSLRHRLPNTLNIAFPGLQGEALLVALDLAGIACSLGSTCASGSAEPAPVLIAMGLAEAVANASVRFSLGVDTTTREIDQAIAIISRVVHRLRTVTDQSTAAAPNR